jgi:Ufm1-specific protease 2
MEDKLASFLGSNQWIGSYEINLCLQYFLGVDSKIMNMSSGYELTTKISELKHHFLTEGTPIMIGGGLYAHTILGIDHCEEKDDVRFLILDPHYTGGDGNIKNIISKGWVAWKDVNMFNPAEFYNLCMPIIPREA